MRRRLAQMIRTALSCRAGTPLCSFEYASPARLRGCQPVWRSPPLGSARAGLVIRSTAAFQARSTHSKSQDAVGELVAEDSNEESEEGVVDALELEVAAVVDTAGCAWAQAALEAVRALLNEGPYADFCLYSFHAHAASRRLDIRLDKLTDKYGSPSLDDLTRFTRELAPRLEEALGTEEAGQVRFDVSSPGGMRSLAVPRELERFRGLALEVEYADDAAGGGPAIARVLTFAGFADGAPGATTRWKLCDVTRNRLALGKKKGQRLSKKELETELHIPTTSISRVGFYLDLDF